MSNIVILFYFVYYLFICSIIKKVFEYDLGNISQRSMPIYLGQNSYAPWKWRVHVIRNILYELWNLTNTKSIIRNIIIITLTRSLKKLTGFTLQTAVFWIFGSMFIVLDLFKWPKWTQKYKMQPGTNKDFDLKTLSSVSNQYFIVLKQYL